MRIASVPLALEALCFLARASFANRFYHFRDTIVLGSKNYVCSRLINIPEVDAIKRSITKVARYVPFRAVCIEQGIAAQWMLRRRGYNAILHFGIGHFGDELKAHVWVTLGDIDVVGGAESADFAEVASFPNQDPRRAPTPPSADRSLGQRERQ